MSKKPSYEELQKRVQELESKALANKMTADALRESEEKYKKLVELSPDPIIIIQDDRYRFINSAFTRLLGYTQEDIENGLSFYEVVQNHDKDTVSRRYQDRISGKQVARKFTIDLISKDGGIIPFESHGIKINHDGRPAFMSIVRDITERKEAEKALRKARDELEKKVEERTAALSKMNERLSREICERNNMEEALRYSENLYRLLAENVRDVIWTFDMNMKPTYLSPSVEKLRGFSVEEAMNHTWDDVFTEESLILAKSAFMKAVKELNTENQEAFNNSYVLELEMKCRDGSTVWTEIHATFLMNSEARPTGIIGVTRNISKRKRAEEQLRESEEKYRLIAETAIEGIYQIDCSGKFVFTNKAFTQMLGYEPGEMVGKHYSVIVPDLNLSEGTEIVRTVLSGTPQKGEFIVKHKFGNEFSAYYSLVPTKKQGQIVGLSGILEDITDLKQTEKLIQSLIHQLIKSQENERQMISRELHDTVAQDLSSSRINCEMILKYNSVTPEIRKKISQVSKNLEKIMKSVRDLSYELRPPGLEKFGLVQTIYQFCKDFSEKTGIQVDFQSAGMNSLNLDYNTKINLYRLLQEGLNNVKKHADAKIVRIRLVSSFPNIILRINDDGKGFDLKARLAKAYKEKRMGLRSMHERVGLLQGKINIESSVGKGTKVVIEIPQITS